MNSWATQRKLQYLGIIALVFLIFVGGPFYFFVYQKPMCSDGRKNGSEIGVDCGGSCRLLCSQDVSEPVSRWDPRLFKVSEGSYSVLAYFENPNVTGEVLNAPYRFQLYDADGILVTERKGNTFIPKASTFAVFEGNIDAGKRVPTRATFEFTQKLVWTRNLETPPDIQISNRSLIKDDSSPRVDATIANRSLGDVPNIELIAVVYDGAGNAIGSSRTFLEDLGKGESKNVVFTWPYPFITKTDICETPVDVALVLDRSGSMVSLGKEPPQPLTDTKNAASYFLNLLSAKDQASVVSFATNASNPVDAPLTADLVSVNKAIQAITIRSEDGIQNTNIGEGMEKALQELLGPSARSGAEKSMVVLTDGVANRPEKLGEEKYAEQFATTIAQDAKNNNVTVFTISLGKEPNVSFLKLIASSTDEFFAAPTTKDLSGIYKQIAVKLCKRKPAVIEILTRIYPSNS